MAYELSLVDGNDHREIVPKLSLVKNSEYYKAVVVNIKKVIKNDNKDDFIKITTDFVVFRILYQ